MDAPHWPRTPVVIGGVRYDLCFTLGTIAEAELEFDRRGIDVDLLDRMPELNLANLRTMFPATLRKCHPEVDRKAAKALVTWPNVFEVAIALRAAWRAAAPVVDEKEPKHNMRKPKQSELELSRTERWNRLWSLGVHDLGLTTEAFYRLTLGQLSTLIGRREREIEEREFLFGQLAAIGVNFSMGRPEHPVKATDFMPSQWRRGPRPPKRMRSRKIIAKEIQMVMEEAMRYQNRQR